MDNSTIESLKNELRNTFPNLSESELNNIDSSMDAFIASVSAKLSGQQNSARELIRKRIEYLQSKGI